MSVGCLSSVHCCPQHIYFRTSLQLSLSLAFWMERSSRNCVLWVLNYGSTTDVNWCGFQCFSGPVCRTHRFEWSLVEEGMLQLKLLTYLWDNCVQFVLRCPQWLRGCGQKPFRGKKLNWPSILTLSLPPELHLPRLYTPTLSLPGHVASHWASAHAAHSSSPSATAPRA